MRVARHAGKTDPGKKRRRNEDSYVIDPPLFAVADGMGGAQAGEVASQLAAAALRDGNGGGGDAQEQVVSLIQEANRRVWQRANEDAAASGMGTTVTAAIVEPDGRVTFGHVGDSRAYVLRGEKLEQLTEDHSLVAELVRRGELSPEEAESHPQRSVITRALGTDPDVDVDTFSVQATAGDVFLICSDGLSSMVDAETIRASVLENRGDLDASARALINAANRGGGEDNITAILFEVGDDDDTGGETVALPAVDPAEPEPEPEHDPDEDTLDIPLPAAVDTMVVSPEDAAQLRATIEAEPAAAARPSLGRRLLVILVIVTLILVIAALVLWGLAR
jgi:serine/threonine protein phosphatase PrpC